VACGNNTQLTNEFLVRRTITVHCSSKLQVALYQMSWRRASARGGGAGRRPGATAFVPPRRRPGQRQWRLARVKEVLARDKQFTSKAGRVRKRLGRPGSEPEKIERAKAELFKGTGIGKTTRLVGLGAGTVHKLKRQMAVAG
jgi:hypothetical protein